MERQNTCQNCKGLFISDPGDFVFYEKIGVPAPTWCSECRTIRRLVWRNERSLYRRKCDAPGHSEDIISFVAPEAALEVYDNTYWYGDSWDPTAYGRDYDFSRSFFEQFRDLMREVPWFARVAHSCVDSEYAHWVVDCNRVYLSSSTLKSEDVLYSSFVDRSKQIVDCYAVQDSELLYGSMNAYSSYRSSFLYDCKDCIDSAYLFDSVNCQRCTLCTGLRNKSYCLRNVQCSKEEYERRVQVLNLQTYEGAEGAWENLQKMMLAFPRRFAHILNAQNVTGDYIRDARDCENVFVVRNAERVKYAFRALDAKDSMDGTGIAGELIYESGATGFGSASCKFHYIASAPQNFHYTYCLLCGSSSHLFGCVGLRKKQYCILNKQYSQTEYEALVSRIVEHMNALPYVDRVGRAYPYGEFFPPEFSPFGYNETVAQEYFPLTQEEALVRGFNWREVEKKNVPGALPKETILCTHKGECRDQCTTVFRFIPRELEFYRMLGVPLPRLCPNCRYAARVSSRPALTLFPRQCDCVTDAHDHGKERCAREFVSAYNPNRLEVVYCETCYISEVS